MTVSSSRITLFVLKEADGAWRGSSWETTYRALTRDVLTSALKHAAFEDVTRHRPADTGFYQPMVTAAHRP